MTAPKKGYWALLLALGASVAVSGTSVAAPFQNGSFETGTSPGAFLTVSAGDSTTITGWTVSSGSVDYIGTYWVSAAGVRSLDMNGGSAGTITQSFDTVLGTVYTVSFSLAGNPDGGGSLKTLTTTGGAQTAAYTFNTTGKSTSNMGWTTQTFSFTALGSTSTLAFMGDPTTGAYGPALDNVSVVATPEPVSLLALGSGLVGLGLLRRKRG